MKAFPYLAAVLVLVLLGGGAFLLRLHLEGRYIVFEGLHGPRSQTPPARELTDMWKLQDTGGPSRLAVLLTDTDSAWTGLVHGLKTLGVPLRVTDEPAVALEHGVVLAYPMISGSVLDREALVGLREYVSGGGTLVASNVLGGGLENLFGFASAEPGRGRYALHWQPRADDPLVAFSHPRERVIRLGNPDRPESLMGTHAYVGAETALAVFNDGAPAITAHRFGDGTAYAIGFDPGFFLLRGYNDRDSEASRDYVNAYEPSADVFLRFLRRVYRRHQPAAVTLDTVPDGRDLSVIISHDVDYAGSLRNSLAYAELEETHGVRATYYMQTKYYRDYFDTVFFDADTEALLQELRDRGMEIASHSVSHTDVFADLPVGTGGEAYPDYQPRVRGVGDTVGATVLGELRVSKFLLEHFSGETVVSFRPGFLAFPPALAQALSGTGYRFSSSVTAPNVLTHLPYRMNYDREYRSPTRIFEFPISIEDEHPPEMDRRLDAGVALARQLATYGATCGVLIHPDVLDHKYRFLEGFLPAVNDFSWFGTQAEFGAWWAARDAVEVDLHSTENGGYAVVVESETRIAGLSLVLPDGYVVDGPGREVSSARASRRWLLPAFSGRLDLRLQPH